MVRGLKICQCLLVVTTGIGLAGVESCHVVPVALVSSLTTSLELLLHFLDALGERLDAMDAGQLITMSSKVTGGVRIQGNYLSVVGSSGAAVGILFTGSQTTGSGMCSDNYVSSLDTTAALLATAGTGITFIQNFYTGAADKSGAVWPVADNPA